MPEIDSATGREIPIEPGSEELDEAERERIRREEIRAREEIETLEDVGPLTLNDALLEFQKRAIRITKDATAKVKTQKGADFSYKYVKLETLLDEVLPVLNELGMIWTTQPCTLDDGQTPALKYELRFVHTDETIGGRMPLMLRQGTPQDLGAAISYARRYSMIALLNLATEDDEDGQIRTSQGGGEGRGVKRITRERATRIVAQATQAGLIGWPEPGGNLLQLAAAHVHGGDIDVLSSKRDAIEALMVLTQEEANQITTWIERKVTEKAGGEDE